jgi:DNA-binding HxlR family transcriptional regulator
VFGDRWSLIVLRDIMFGNRRHFRTLLTASEEGIASNILADRLKRLTASGLLAKSDDPSHRQKSIYSLTEQSIQLVPVFATLGAWGIVHLDVSRDLAIRARLLAEGGASMWDDFMEELRVIHLGQAPVVGARSVIAELRAAFEAERQAMTD